MITLIISTADEELVRELDDLAQEMLLLLAYQKELLQNVSDIMIAQVLTMTELKVSNNVLKCLIAHKADLYQKISKGEQTILLQAMKGIFSSSISHSQLCLELVISVYCVPLTALASYL